MIFLYILVILIFIPFLLEDVWSGAVDIITHPIGLSVIGGIIALIIIYWDKIKKVFENTGASGASRVTGRKECPTGNTNKTESASSGYSFLETVEVYPSVKATYGKGYVYLGLVHPEIEHFNFPNATYSNGYIYDSTNHSSSHIIGRYQNGKIYKGSQIGYCDHIAVYENGCIKKDTYSYSAWARYDGDEEGAAAAALLCILKGEIGDY